jgi:hypothetical protein
MVFGNDFVIKGEPIDNPLSFAGRSWLVKDQVRAYRK